VTIKQSDRILRSSQMTRSQNKEIKRALSIYLKLFLNYIQMISIIQSLQLNWPFYVGNYLNIYSNIGGATTQILSFDCLVQDHNIKTEMIYIQTVVLLSIPFTIILVTFLILAIVYLLKRSSQIIRMIVVFVVVSIFLQPAIIQNLFDNITCTNLDNINVLQANMNIECDTDSHQNWVFFLFK